MKKALVILMALTMVFAAFADGPDVTPTVTSFTGSATIGYKIDLDAETTGIYNTQDTTLKIQWIGGAVSKSTEGTGLWGELTIKADGQVEVTNPNAASLAVPTPTVETAKIHINDMIAINILCPSLAIGAKAPSAATGTNVAGVAAVGTDLAPTAGFAVEVTTDPVDVTVKVQTNGEQKAADKKVAGAITASVKAVADLTLNLGATYNEKAAFAADAAYKIALNDTMALTPMAAVTYTDKAAWCAGALFGWGATGQEPGFAYVADKTADGVSFVIDNTKAFVVGAYDSVFLKDLGLKYGADYAANLDKVGEGVLNVGVKFAKDIDIFSVAAYADYTTALAAKTDDYKYGVSVSNATLIANTTLKAAYDNVKGKKGAIDLSAKIAF